MGWQAHWLRSPSAILRPVWPAGHFARERAGGSRRTSRWPLLLQESGAPLSSCTPSDRAEALHGLLVHGGHRRGTTEYLQDICDIMLAQASPCPLPSPSAVSSSDVSSGASAAATFFRDARLQTGTIVQQSLDEAQ
mmetsp:Transcript_183170/g.580724  ORF Transcript_183170/g.580724 Transcript_183170/m.580724 type:complete len:136 (-) Transcript_183170:87-494(-)